ncbi:DUF4232 domain-containing protein [Arthrobacter bussei]|uniref:DUF4232 domain-containing protein n=1 Tax=Arthrobacter bussei TaxID=2594179 RepID=A0A7X1NSF2_9MICC|nr:DUF4232 domain-containing protein [Arthrobacter bussei]MPY12151.1 hypothetical protein [Arthrobacter bussei]
MAHTGDHGSGRRGGRRASPAVYRRRRLAVLILAVLVVAVLAIGGMALAGTLGRTGGATAGASTSPEAPTAAPAPSGTATSAPSAQAPSAPPTAAPTAAPTATPSAGPTTASPGPTPSDGCAAAQVVVSAETDRESYGSGESPVLVLVVRNEGEKPCTVNVGTSQMAFEITSDGERIFSSTDCQQGSQDLERTIAPGGEERATFQWTRNRTVPGCTVVDEEPGAGDYTVITRLGARSSASVDFTLQ